LILSPFNARWIPAFAGMMKNSRLGSRQNGNLHRRKTTAKPATRLAVALRVRCYHSPVIFDGGVRA